MLSCIVIPHFDHLGQFRPLLRQLVELHLPLIVVDDGSPDDVFEALQGLLESEAPGTTLIRHELNLGKGGAMITGLKAARSSGFTHALQIDADGQHDAGSLPDLLREAGRYPDHIVCGQAVFGQQIPGLRFYARYLTLYFCWLETLSTRIRDALCGFRAYPLDRVVELIDSSPVGTRMAFDPEILVRACWAGIPITYLPVKVLYPPGGRSHFRYFRDNVEISWMHTRLVFGMLVRLPRLLQQRFSGPAVRRTP